MPLNRRETAKNELVNYLRAHKINMRDSVEQILGNASKIAEDFITRNKPEYADLHSFLTESTINLFAESPQIQAAVQIGITAKMPLGGSRQLWTYQTIADGSCGIYAIIGQKQFRVDTWYYSSDAKKVRMELAALLMKVFKRDRTLPREFQETLKEYLAFSENAPAKFKDALSTKYEEYRGLYCSLSGPESSVCKEDVKKEFASNEQVIKAYLDTIADPSHYLLENELIGAGHLLKYEVILFKMVDGRLQCYDPLTRLYKVLSDDFTHNKKYAFIYFRPSQNNPEIGHYELAKIASIRKK
jgi:hypothetical protein